MHPSCLPSLPSQPPSSSAKSFCSFILKFWELFSCVTHLHVLDGLPGVQGVEAGEVGRLLDDGLVPVQGTRDRVGPTRAVTRDIASRETHVTRAHVMGVGDAQVVVKPDTQVSHGPELFTGCRGWELTRVLWVKTLPWPRYRDATCRCGKWSSCGL